MALAVNVGMCRALRYEYTIVKSKSLVFEIMLYSAFLMRWISRFKTGLNDMPAVLIINF